MAAILLSDQLKTLIGRTVSVFSSRWSGTGRIVAIGDDYLVISDAAGIQDYAPFVTLNFLELIP